jgi:hypothetical protein
MKLAEALNQRADLQRRIAQLRERLSNNVKVQEGDQPAEKPEDLFKELEAALKQLKRRDVRRVSFSPWGMITMQTDGTKWIVSQDVDPEMNDFIERFKYNHPWWIF